MPAEMTSTEIQQKEQLARFLWTGFILMFFAVQAIIWMIAILMTSNDASHAVVRDFEAKSELPPSRAERTEANRALGWTASLKVLSAQSKPVGSNREAEMEMTLTEKNGLPIEVPFVDLTAFHCAKAAEVQTIRLSRQQPGIYRGMIQLNQRGQWQFDGKIQRNQETLYFGERLSL